MYINTALCIPGERRLTIRLPFASSLELLYIVPCIVDSDGTLETLFRGATVAFLHPVIRQATIKMVNFQRSRKIIGDHPHLIGPNNLL